MSAWLFFSKLTRKGHVVRSATLLLKEMLLWGGARMKTWQNILQSTVPARGAADHHSPTNARASGAGPGGARGGRDLRRFLGPRRRLRRPRLRRPAVGQRHRSFPANADTNCRPLQKLHSFSFEFE